MFSTVNPFQFETERLHVLRFAMFSQSPGEIALLSSDGAETSQVFIEGGTRTWKYFCGIWRSDRSVLLHPRRRGRFIKEHIDTWTVSFGGVKWVSWTSPMWGVHVDVSLAHRPRRVEKLSVFAFMETQRYGLTCVWGSSGSHDICESRKDSTFPARGKKKHPFFFGVSVCGPVFFRLWWFPRRCSHTRFSPCIRLTLHFLIKSTSIHKTEKENTTSRAGRGAVCFCKPNRRSSGGGLHCTPLHSGNCSSQLDLFIVR